MVRRWLVVSVGLAACQPNLGGGGTGSATANTVGADSGDSSATGATSGMTSADTGVGDASGGSDATTTSVDTTGPTGPDESSTNPGDDSSTGPLATDGGEAPMLVIAEAPLHDFGDVALGDDDTVLLMVSNEGTGAATGMAGQALTAPFGYVGGSYPGVGGDCGDTLDPAASCTIEVEFSPAELGPYTDTLAVTYDGAAMDATCDLIGGGAGDSGNLLLNPGGENTGYPPPDWQIVGGGDWWAGVIFDDPAPHAGSSYLLADTGPDSPSVFTLRQDVDVSAWADLIDAGLLSFSFEGWARTYFNDNDYFRFRIRFRDDAGMVIEVWNTDWQTSDVWELHDDMRTMPAGTRSLRVDLGCEKFGGTYCNAYFDAMDLRVSYP